MIQILRMTPIPYDLAIIGGGPAGLACALGAGRRRLSVLLLEKHLPGRKLLISGKRTRGYLRHLFMSREMLGPILLATHNLTYYQRLVARARAALERNRFAEFYQERMAAYQQASAGEREPSIISQR